MSSLDGDFRKPGRGDEDDEHDSHAEFEVRWLLPYADMITLLFALFIVMFAISSVNNTKLEELSKSVSKAFNGNSQKAGHQVASPKPSDTPQNASESLLNSGATLAQLQQAVANAKETQAEQQRLRRLKERIDDYARKHGLSDKISTVIDERGLAIRLVSDKVLFDSGQAHVRPSVQPVLRDIANLLKGERNHIRVEGHTDNVPITSGQFPTNWELSAMRATTVLRLINGYGIPSTHLSAVGYGSKRPLRSNDSESGRARNRRVEIVVLRSASLGGPTGDALGG